LGAIIIRRTEEGTNGAVISDLGNHTLDPDVVDQGNKEYPEL